MGAPRETDPRSTDRMTDAAYAIARIAHWLLNDQGFTREHASRELTRLARTMDPTLDMRVFGDATRFIERPKDGAA